jgi:hypothetical protein
MVVNRQRGENSLSVGFYGEEDAGAMKVGQDRVEVQFRDKERALSTKACKA